MLLITADGSQENEGGGELRVIDLFYAESLTAMKLLSKGGHFVIKIFTVFECETISLVYLLCCAFEEVHQFKPVSSREASSETYLVCKGYKFGKEDAEFQDYLKAIEEHRKNADKKDFSMFPLESIPTDFLDRIHSAMKYFCDLQMAVINANINSYPHTVYVHEHRRRIFIREEIERRFRKAYKIDPLPRELRLAPFMEKQVERFEVNNNYLGSWEDENVTKKAMTNDELKFKYRDDLKIVRSSFQWPYPQDETQIEWGDGENGIKGNIEITRGREILQIRNSRFITKRLMGFFRDVIELDYDHLKGSVEVKSTELDKMRIVLPITIIKNSLRDHEDEFAEQLVSQLKLIADIPISREITFENVLLVGQRSVGLIYLISKIVQPTEARIKLCSSGKIVLSNVNSSIAAMILNELSEVISVMEDKTVHGIVPICQLRENVPHPFYDLIKLFNNFCCVDICEKLLQSDIVLD